MASEPQISSPSIAGWVMGDNSYIQAIAQNIREREIRMLSKRKRDNVERQLISRGATPEDYATLDTAEMIELIELLRNNP